MLAQAGAVATWLGMAGQWVGSIATASVAVLVYRWKRQDAEAEQRDKEKAQAALVMIDVDYNSTGDGVRLVITNHSKQQVRWPKIETISNAQPKVRWADGVQLFDDDGEQYWLRPKEVLLPGESDQVPFQHFDAKGQPIGLLAVFRAQDQGPLIKRGVQVSDVTISFDMFGARWWRVGNGDPVQIEPPASEGK